MTLLHAIIFVFLFAVILSTSPLWPWVNGLAIVAMWVWAGRVDRRFDAQ